MYLLGYKVLLLVLTFIVPLGIWCFYLSIYLVIYLSIYRSIYVCSNVYEEDAVETARQTVAECSPDHLFHLFT